MKTTVIPASALGDDWRASAHVKHEVSRVDLDKLADIRRKRAEYLRRLKVLDNHEETLLRRIANA